MEDFYAPEFREPRGGAGGYFGGARRVPVVAPVIAGEQVLLLLHGGPGTGKTHGCGVIERNLHRQGTESLAASFMWSAVYQMKVQCKKMSLHSLLKGTPFTLTADALSTPASNPSSLLILELQSNPSAELF